MFNKKEMFSQSGFPDHLASDEEKELDEYGLKMAKAIEREWFYRQNDTNCKYYDRRTKYHNLRLYARGEQDTDIYKRLLGGNEDTYTNYDWRPLQVVPKFVKLIVNQMTERLFDIKAEAIDQYSTDLKDEYRKNLEKFLMAKPAMAEAKKYMGQDLFPDDAGSYPDSQEEVDLFMKLKFKPAIEIACEEAIKYTLKLNEYSEVQKNVIEDITTLGIAAIKHRTDPNKGIVVEWVDPSNLVYSYPKHKNFKDVHYYGEVDRITINEVKRLSNGKFSQEELRDIVNSSADWNKYQGIDGNTKYVDKEDDLTNMMVDVLYFNYKTTKTINYKKKYNKSGGYKMTKKESTFSKKDSSYKGYDVSKKVIDVWYEGILILGSDKLIEYKLCENMIRPEGYLNKTLPNYIVYSPDIYRNETKSLVETVVPYVDQMQQIHIKIQQMIAKARPNGIYIDVTGLNEIDLGDGNFLDPLEAIKIYDETGNVLGASSTIDNEFNHGREPIKELKNGVIDGLDRLINSYNHYLNLLRDSIGIPQGADASMPHPDTLVGVQQQVALNSNTATRHILDSALSMSETLGKGLALRLKDIFLYSDLKNSYINAIGKINVETLKALKNYHLHDLGVSIELKPDLEEKQHLENNIMKALARDQITFDDAVDIRNIGNIKLSNELLKTRRIRREKAKQQNEIEKIKEQGKAQAQAAQAASQSKMQELEAESRFDILLENTKSKNKEKELMTEAQVKSGLMEKEFEYNMILKGQEERIASAKEKYKEDRKDSRQDRANSQASVLAEQKAKGGSAVNFESTEDNITGGIDLSEQVPN